MSKVPLTYWEISRSGSGAKNLFKEQGQRGFLIPEDYNYICLGDRSCRINMYAENVEEYYPLKQISQPGAGPGGNYRGPVYESKPSWPYTPIEIADPRNETGVSWELWGVPKGATVYRSLSQALCRGAYIHSDSIRSLDRWMGFIPNVYSDLATQGGLEDIMSNGLSGQTQKWPFSGGANTIAVSTSRVNDTPFYLVTNRRFTFDFWLPRSLNVYCRARNYPPMDQGPGDSSQPLQPFFTAPFVGYSPGMDVSEWGNLGPDSDAHILRVYYDDPVHVNYMGSQINSVPDLSRYILSNINLDIDYMFQVKLYRDIP